MTARRIGTDNLLPYVVYLCTLYGRTQVHHTQGGTVVRYELLQRTVLRV